MHSIEIRHNVEMAHRLSTASSPPKCVSIHGHSWWVTVRIEGAALDEEGMLLEFGAFKRAWRHFLDTSLDHHLVLRRGDPMVAAIRQVMPDARLLEFEGNPTTEALARWLHGRAEEVVAQLDASVPLRVARLHLQETAVNAAAWEP